MGPSVPSSASAYLRGLCSVGRCEDIELLHLSNILRPQAVTRRGKKVLTSPARYRRYRRMDAITNDPSISSIRIPDNAIAAVVVLETALDSPTFVALVSLAPDVSSGLIEVGDSSGLDDDDVCGLVDNLVTSVNGLRV